MVLPALLVVALAACGTIPAATSPGGNAPPPPSVSTGRPAAPSASPSTTSPGTTPPAKTGPTRTTPTPPPDTWVGHFQGHEIWVPRGHGAAVSFTFDDGPWPGSTAQVLALLAQHHVHAVFCLIGNQARAQPTLVHREVAGGHELCDHSRDHDLSMNAKGTAYVDAEVTDGLADVRHAAQAGTPVRFYRQPGGEWTPTVVAAMDHDGLGPLRWSDDPRDWSRPGSAVIVRRVIAKLHPGAVILMHDGGGDRSHSVEALRFLLDAVSAAGWTPVLAPHVRLSARVAATPQ